MTSPLIQHIKSLLPGTLINEEDIVAHTAIRSIKKGEVLLKEGESCSSVYFVVKGCLYLHYDHNDMQQVVHFALENWWITDYKTFANQSPAVYSITAMEDAELIVMSRLQYESLLDLHPVIALYFNKIHERAYGAALLKQKTYATTSKEDFYTYFKNTYPDILARIPDPIFASYMQVNPDKLMQLKQSCIS